MNTCTPVSRDRVEIKDLQYCDFASQETPCYSASVHIDGALAGTVSNDGQGGASCYMPADLRERVDRLARQQPPLDTGEALEVMDGDTFLAVLVYRTLDNPSA